MGGWIILGLIVAIILFVISIYNRLIAGRNRYKNAFAQIDVQLTRRHDLIPNLVETAKGYMAHERGTLEDVVNARNAAVSGLKAAAKDPTDPEAMKRLAEAEQGLSGAGLSRVGARGLLAIGALAGGLRWVICGFSDHLPTIYASQLLHGVVVTGLFIGGPLYLEAIIPAGLRSTGQTLLSTAGIGVAGILSSVASGWLVEHVGVTTPYAIGGIGAIALGFAVPWILPAPVRAPEMPPGRWEDGVSG